MSSPLDDIFASLKQPAEDVPLADVHVRALEQDAADHSAWVLAVWSDPGGPQALHRELRARVEATFLLALSRTAAQLRERAEHASPPLRALRLAVFPELDAEAAVRAFGLARADATTAAFRQAIAHLRHEAEEVGAQVADEPSTVWEARIAHREENAALEAKLLATTADEAWGQSPGAPAARLASAIAGGDGDGPSLDLDGLRAVEDAIVQRDPGPVRFIPPLVFQALCDHVALAMRRRGVEVEWAECAPDDSGIAPPPLVRVRTGGAYAHVPLALEVLRWCVMPIQPGETIPPLADWVAHAFPER